MTVSGVAKRATDRETLLFVDDDDHVRRAFKNTMERRGFDVRTAQNGIEAIRLAQVHAFPVIVTDLRMPGMDGMSLIERLHVVLPNTSFVLATGLPDVDLRRDGEIDQAIVSIVPKPWDADEMASVVRRALTLHRERAGIDDGELALTEDALNVLLIEDNPGDARLVERYLARLNGAPARVFGVELLRDAVELLRDHDFHVALADLSLPDARGLDTVRKLHEIAPETAIVCLTGMKDDALAVQAVQLGAQDYLSKDSLSQETLSRAIRYAVERKRAEQRLAHMAFHDQLTGLANRSTFRDKLEHAMSRCSRQRGRFAVMFLDLDRFKAINDSMGHDAGDLLLREVGNRVVAAVREYDTVARFGGDEFAVLVEDLENENVPVQVARRVLDAFTKPMAINEEYLTVTPSIGIALYPDSADTIDGLLKSADAAMYQAKERGGNDVEFGITVVEVPAIARRELESELKEAVKRRQFFLAYQPEVDVRANRVATVEALLRWRQPNGCIVSPGDFIPALEETGLISTVGAWVLMSACLDLKRFRDHGFRNVRVAVNLSAIQFEEPGLFETVRQALRQASLTPDSLELEITESTLMRDTQKTNDTLARLKKLGVRIAIDDFGTGYSSLAYLQRFDVDVLKIDRSFVTAIDRQTKEASIAGAIVGLGRQLELEVVAEGVETTKQLTHLRDQGCDLMQGFMLGRPNHDLAVFVSGEPRSPLTPVR